MSDKSIVSQIKINNIGNHIASSAYGICTTAANVATKQVVFQNDNNIRFILSTGITIHIKFTYHNAATNATLKIGNNNIPIKKYGSTAVGNTSTTSWKDGAVVSFTYDGINWIMNDFTEQDIGDDGEQIEIPEPGDVVNNVSAISSNVGVSDNYSRTDHVHKIAVSQGSNNGGINIAGVQVKPRGIAAAAFQGVTNTIENNDQRTSVLTTPKAIKDYVATQIPQLPTIPESFGTVASTGQSSITADVLKDTLNILPGTHTSVTLNSTAKSVTIGSTLTNKVATENSTEVSLVTAGDKYRWDHITAEASDFITMDDNSDFNPGVYRKMIVAARWEDSPYDLPDIVPPDFTYSIYYNQANGDLQFFRQSSEEIIPDSGASTMLTLTYDDDNYNVDMAGKLKVTFNADQ